MKRLKIHVHSDDCPCHDHDFDHDAPVLGDLPLFTPAELLALIAAGLMVGSVIVHWLVTT